MCDYEVFEFMKLNHGDSNQDLKTLSYEMATYFTKQPCSAQTNQGVSLVMKGLQNYELTKSEKLMIINNRPLTVVGLVPLIEECNLRFQMNQLEDIVSLLAEHVPWTRPEDDEED